MLVKPLPQEKCLYRCMCYVIICVGNANVTHFSRMDCPILINWTNLFRILEMLCHKHKLSTNLWHRKEEPHNTHETPERQTKQSNQLSLHYGDDCKTRIDTK